jgi:hypothetical protein
MKSALLLVLACSISFDAIASDVGVAPQSKASDWERYKILTQRNIFSKDRGRRDERRSDERKDKEKEAPPEPKPEADILLIGIVEKDGQLAAFFENSKTGKIEIVKSGEAIARGKLAAISMDSIEYVRNETTTAVTIGKTLDGATAENSSGEPVRTSTTDASGTPLSSDANSLIDKMRRKRQEEMRK